MSSQPQAIAAPSPTLRGVLWMLGAVMSFAGMAIAVRELQRHMGSFEIVVMRTLVMLALACAFVSRTGLATVRTQRIRMHFGRNLVHLLGQILWVYSIGALTLATVFAIEFTMPVWTAILAAIFLHEKLTPPRLVQLALGLVGVLIILDRKSTRLNSSHLGISYAVFCLKKKKKII